jgi:hypothetical protein
MKAFIIIRNGEIVETLSALKSEYFDRLVQYLFIDGGSGSPANHETTKGAQLVLTRGVLSAVKDKVVEYLMGDTQLPPAEYRFARQFLELMSLCVAGDIMKFDIPAVVTNK